jgi:hypothetical protein
MCCIDRSFNNGKIQSRPFLIFFFFYSFDCMEPISFSSFMALPMSPLIFNLPVMNAAVAFSLPAQNF